MGFEGPWELFARLDRAWSSLGQWKVSSWHRMGFKVLPTQTVPRSLISVQEMAQPPSLPTSPEDGGKKGRKIL
uniref:Uncharacterized protein n=1 Tax=Geospiza parvula TaxID=87175 RepID=A0A8U8BVQ1_GEOPR